MAGIRVGERLPPVRVFEGSPGSRRELPGLFRGLRGVLLGVPGAFTPACTHSHLSGFVAAADELRARGVALVACVAVNDIFVLNAWGQALGATGKVRMLADPTGAFGKATNLLLDQDPMEEIFGNRRLKRFSMLLDDGVVTRLNVEPDGTGLSCSLAGALLAQL
ncbi:peroxiredoxin-5, mitochondrial [Eudromia elegans]